MQIVSYFLSEVPSKPKTTSIYCVPFPPAVTSTALLLIQAVLDAVVLLINVLVAPDLTEHTASLLGQPALDQPTRALRQEQEADELQHSGEHRQTQHVPEQDERNQKAIIRDLY